ncbi:hypothetical protein [Paludisphaera rhizosphaerae]|uniref:hypothetical protein n=1 Tax=Paludisphaera rhizosphaerae TaxID=2711216 RepID=UPI0013EC2333|nr:hypothetical protein [Paludisphaera rhizosphaerae]
MTWLMRRKTLAGAAALFLVTAGVAVQGGRQAPPKAEDAPPPTARDLARQQLELADQAVDVTRRLVEAGRANASDGTLLLWERRRLEALRKTGAGKAEMIAALEKYIESMKHLEAIAEARRERALTTSLEVYDARFQRLEGEIWLNEEKAR